jgi:hypothetical protein
MKSNYILAMLLCGTLASQAQTARDYAVTVQATVSKSPASIKLTWQNHALTDSVFVYRKAKEAKLWGQPVLSGGKAVTEFTDNTVSSGQGYEYFVRRKDSSRTAYGYIYAGMKVPHSSFKGRLLLLVDANYVLPLDTAIKELEQDMRNDGWIVKRVDVSRAASVAAVKGIISSEMSSSPLQALYLLGHIPVPYSGGFIAAQGFTYPPDGHPDHSGAWPADLYYGVMNESIWTDTDVNDTTAGRSANHNVPGDGKFDQMYIYPDTVALQIGRVDLTNMPLFGNDTLLIKQYLEKAHRYKTGQVEVMRRALIDDNFGANAGEAFASTAWRDFTTMFGDSVYSRDFLTNTKNGSYLFSYGCGAGGYTSCSGVGTSNDFRSDSINTIFTMFFGSYFGDWDNTNNLLRAPLASPSPTLTNAWSGRPHWHVHHMTLGENIGYSTRLTQNNYYEIIAGSLSGYVFNIYPTFIHQALMGDPTLRLHSMKPVSEVEATTHVDSMSVQLTWHGSADAQDGYVVLRAENADGPYIPLTVLAATDTNYSDPSPLWGINHYMVRARRLETTASGSYYNLSLGATDSAMASMHTSTNESTGLRLNVSIFPNPANTNITVWLAGADANSVITLLDITGRKLDSKPVINDQVNFELSSLATGMYFVHIQKGETRLVRKVVKQ